MKECNRCGVLMRAGDFREMCPGCHVSELEAARAVAERDKSELATLRAEVERLRMPDDVERTFRAFLTSVDADYFDGTQWKKSPAGKALAWLDGLYARKDVP